MTTAIELPQHLTALARGNYVRLTRAAAKRHIAELPTYEGREAVCQIILEPGSLWRSAKLDYLLRAPRGSGKTFATRMLYAGQSPLSPLKTVGSLTDRQRVELTDAIRGYGRAGT